MRSFCLKRNCKKVEKVQNTSLVGLAKETQSGNSQKWGSDMTKRNQKKSQKFDSLITAAFDLFEKKEVTAVSIDEIVQKAGVAKGTFYLYFHNKPDLIGKLILKKASEYLSEEALHPKIETAEDFDDSAQKYLDYLTSFLESNLTLTKLIDKNVHLCVRAVLENTEGALGDLYSKIVTYFTERGIPEREINIKMYIYLETVVSSCCNAILRNQPGTIEEVKPNLYDIITLSRYHLIEQREQKV